MGRVIRCQTPFNWSVTCGGCTSICTIEQRIHPTNSPWKKPWDRQAVVDRPSSERGDNVAMSRCAVFHMIFRAGMPVGMMNTTLLIYFLCTHENVANTTYVFAYIYIYAWMDMQENAIYVHISIFKNRMLLNPKMHLATIAKIQRFIQFLIGTSHPSAGKFPNKLVQWTKQNSTNSPLKYFEKNIAGLCRPSVHQKKILHHHFGEFFGQRKKNNNNL